MSHRLARRVLLIGWDAADWTVIGPLLDAGEMPALQSLIESGVMGNIATLRPMLSPMLWTSIATGVRPFHHGIHGFTEPDPVRGGIRPIAVTARKKKAVWNILHQNGFTSNVVGWWPSHPAEPIRGVVVSNRYHRAERPAGDPWPLPPGTVHPPDRAQRLADLRLHPEEIPGEALDLFVPRGREIDQSKDRRLFNCARLLADCTSVHACATALIQEEPWDFMAVYYDAIDHFSHGFMKYHPPRRPFIAERDFELYQHVVASAYRYHDMMLATLLQLAGPDTTVILLSDHGFHPDHLRPDVIPDEPAGPAAEHSPYGIFVMRGPGILRDERIYGASLLDIAPTILTLFGLPIGRDMDGKPLVQALTQTPPIETIPSWEDVAGDAGCHPPNLRVDPADSQEAIRQLVGLGYIEDPGDDLAAAAADSVRELRYNLAQSYIDAHRWRDALPLLEQLWSEHPDELRFGRLLAEAYRQLGRLGEFRATVESVGAARERLAAESIAKLRQWHERIGLDNPAALERLSRRESNELRRLRLRAAARPESDLPLLISLLLAEGREEEALTRLRQLSVSSANEPFVFRFIGQTLGRLGRNQEAEQSFRRALELNPRDAQSLHGLAAACFARKEYEQCVEAALSATGLLFYFPQAHLLLGRALERLGDYERAAGAFRVAVRQAPGFARAHLQLARLYKYRLDDLGLASLHLAKAFAARKQRTAAAAAAAAEDVPAPAPPPAGASAPAPQPLAAADQAEDVITIVSGLPRSGTSVMMRMLSAAGLPMLADGRRTPDSDNPHGYFEDERVKQLARDTAWLSEARGQVVKVVAPLLSLLPPGERYRVIFMERDIEEVLDSQQTMLDRLGREGARLSRERLSRSLQEQVARVKALLHVRQIPVHYVAYRDVMEDGPAVAARVSRFLGAGADPARMAAAIDPSLGRHRRPASSAAGA